MSLPILSSVSTYSTTLPANEIIVLSSTMVHIVSSPLMPFDGSLDSPINRSGRRSVSANSAPRRPLWYHGERRDDYRLGRRPASPGTSLIGSRPRRMKAHWRWPRRREWGLLRRLTRALFLDYNVLKGTGAFPPCGLYSKAAGRLVIEEVSSVVYPHRLSSLVVATTTDAAERRGGETGAVLC